MRKNDSEGKIVAQKIVKERLSKEDYKRKKDCERKIVKERLWKGDWKTEWEQNVKRGSLHRYGKSFWSIFPHFCKEKQGQSP